MLILVDWGSSNLRALLLDDEGHIIDTGRKASGVLTCKHKDLEEELNAVIGTWLAKYPDTPVLLSGMIGSRNGWREAPYLPCPATAEDISRNLMHLPEYNKGKAWIVPGLRTTTGNGATDVMRGEEVQIIGALCWSKSQNIDAPDLIILPGTHSKWTRVDHECIAGFSTAMTGEIFALLCGAGSIASLLAADEPWDPAQFEQGLTRSEHKGGLLHQLFTLRAEIVTNRLPSTGARSHLSGLLIGDEIRRLSESGNKTALIIGTEELANLYNQAIQSVGITGIILSDATAIAWGGWEIARCAKLV